MQADSLHDVRNKLNSFFFEPDNEDGKISHIDSPLKHIRRGVVFSDLIPPFPNLKKRYGQDYPTLFTSRENEKEWLDALDDAETRSVFAVNDDALGRAYKYIGKNLQQTPSMNAIFTQQVLSILAHDAQYTLTQVAELLNANAYSRAETGLGLDLAQFDSAVAVVITMFQLRAIQGRDVLRSQLQRKLAQYIDTYSWTRYRAVMRLAEKISSESDQPLPSHHRTDNFLIEASMRHTNELLDQVERALRAALQYDGKRAIIHYHLARVYLSRVEITWQHFPQIANDMSHFQHYSQYLDRCLTQALREWRIARELDLHGRLHAKLNWLYNRINRYK